MNTRLPFLHVPLHVSPSYPYPLPLICFSEFLVILGRVARLKFRQFVLKLFDI